MIDGLIGNSPLSVRGYGITGILVRGNSRKGTARNVQSNAVTFKKCMPDVINVNTVFFGLARGEQHFLLITLPKAGTCGDC